MFSGYIRASGDDKHGVDLAWLKPCPIPSWNVAHRNAKCRSLSDHIRGHTLVYASLSSVSNLRWFSFPTFLGSSTCFCFCCRCYCHLSLLYPCLFMFMRLSLWAILVKSSVACGVYWFWTAIPFWPLNWNRPSSPVIMLEPSIWSCQNPACGNDLDSNKSK